MNDDATPTAAGPYPHLLSALLKTGRVLMADLDVDKVCTAVLKGLEEVFGATSSWILLHDQEAGVLRAQLFRGPGAHSYRDASIPTTSGIVGLVFRTKQHLFIPDVAAENRWYDPERVRAAGLRTVFAVPLIHKGHPIGVIGFDSPRFGPGNAPTSGDVAGLELFSGQASLAIANARLYQASEADRRRLRALLAERRRMRSHLAYLREEVREVFSAGNIVGTSQSMREVLRQIDLVASADTTVLVQGETGTGKELVARLIHERSSRAHHPFVAVNCAALPEALVESELFGHEKGAFTGALMRKPGKFEVAHRGTLFLDEVGDLPAEAQAKLLRVLEDGEVQPVGSTRPTPVNVRVVAATHKTLGPNDPGFRADLYFRLSVFPITMPPLRVRREDIPVLARHFAERLGRKLGKQVRHISDSALARLVTYDWPGNVRELQNIIERAAIISSGPVIRDEDVLLPEPSVAADGNAAMASAPRNGDVATSTTATTLADANRRAILAALAASHWRVSGRGGAAERLGLKATTLHAKMRKLRIARPKDPSGGAVPDPSGDAT